MVHETFSSPKGYSIRGTGRMWLGEGDGGGGGGRVWHVIAFLFPTLCLWAGRHSSHRHPNSHREPQFLHVDANICYTQYNILNSAR